jgi:hypothetical protein
VNRAPGRGKGLRRLLSRHRLLPPVRRHQRQLRGRHSPDLEVQREGKGRQGQRIIDCLGLGSAASTLRRLRAPRRWGRGRRRRRHDGDRGRVRDEGSKKQCVQPNENFSDNM